MNTRTNTNRLVGTGTNSSLQYVGAVALFCGSQTVYHACQTEPLGGFYGESVGFITVVNRLSGEAVVL